MKSRLCGATVNEKRVMKPALAPGGAEKHASPHAPRTDVVKGKIIVICSVKVSAVNFPELRKQRAWMWRRFLNVHVLLHVRACGDCPGPRR